MLSQRGSSLFHAGALGSGAAMSLLDNAVVGATYAVVTDGLTVGTRFGLEPRVIADVVSTSAGRSVNIEIGAGG